MKKVKESFERLELFREIMHSIYPHEHSFVH